MITNEVERLTGLSKQSILYYEKEGLLQVLRKSNGYRDYTEENIKTLLMIRYLRALDISLDDIRFVLDGTLSLHECLDVQEQYLANHEEELKRIHAHVKQLKERELPLLMEMEEIRELDEETWFRLRRANAHVAIGRQPNAHLLKKRIAIYIVAAIQMMVLFYFSIFIVTGSFLSLLYYLPLSVFTFIVFSFIFLRCGTMLSNLYGNATFFLNINEPWMEFVEDHVLYMKERSTLANVRYLLDVLAGKQQEWIKTIPYENIQEVKITVQSRYMNATAGMVAIPIVVPCFTFTFTNKEHIYLEGIDILDDDAKWLAHILKEKVVSIKDECHVLQAFEEEINLNEFLKGKKLPLRSYV